MAVRIGSGETIRQFAVDGEEVVGPRTDDARKRGWGLAARAAVSLVRVTAAMKVGRKITEPR